LRLSDQDYRALGQFRRAMREFLAFGQQSSREHGLSAQQHQALLAIRSHEAPDPMTVGELAQCLMVKNHTAVELVGRLVERELVARRQSDDDRRRVLLELRPRGAQILEDISVLNLGQLEETADILADLMATVRRIERSQGACGLSSDRAAGMVPPRRT
jgi:DNA-binding MarR family transcriptional regulator